MRGLIASNGADVLQRTLLVLCGALAIAFFYEAAAPLSDVAVPTHAARALAPLAPAPERFAPPPLATFAVVNARPIFSPERAPIEPAAVASASGSAPLSKAVLVGVIMDPLNRLALIKIAASSLADAYGLGATIEGWKVWEIDADKVVLRSGAAQQEIRLDADLGTSADGRIGPRSAPVAPIVAGPPAEELPPRLSANSVAMDGAQRVAQSRPSAGAGVQDSRPHGNPSRPFVKPMPQDSGPHSQPSPPNLQ